MLFPSSYFFRSLIFELKLKIQALKFFQSLKIGKTRQIILFFKDDLKMLLIQYRSYLFFPSHPAYCFDSG